MGDEERDLNEVMQNAFELIINKENRYKPVTNEMLHLACQQMIQAIAKGFEAKYRSPEQAKIEAIEDYVRIQQVWCQHNPNPELQRVLGQILFFLL
jgi:hypothetical protein